MERKIFHIVYTTACKIKLVRFIEDFTVTLFTIKAGYIIGYLDVDQT